jgi:hypothetical protein
MEKPASAVAQSPMKIQATPEEVAELIYVGEELLSKAKVIARRIRKHCRHLVEDDRSNERQSR